MRFEQAELRIFHAIIHQGGFRKAADALHLTQSAVSQSLKTLETKLDCPLIIRGRNLQLTSVGRRMMLHADKVVQNEEDLLEDLTRIKKGDLAVLSIAIDSTNNRFHAPMMLSNYCRQLPGTKLKVAEMPSLDIVQSVLTGRSELGFGPFQREMNAFESIPLYTEKRLLVISPHHPSFKAIRDNLENPFVEQPLIVSSLDEPDQRPYIGKLRDQFQTVWEITSLQLRLNLIDQGLGIGFVSELVLAEFPQYAHLVHLSHLSFGTIERKVGIYFRKGKELSKSEIDFIGICKDYLCK